MGIEKKTFCADLILADAIIDMADEDGITWQEARSKIIQPYMISKMDCGKTGRITSEIITKK